MSFSYFFNEKLLELFLEAGWTFGRKADLSRFFHFAPSYGISFNQISISILKEFWGLKITDKKTGNYLTFSEIGVIGCFDSEVLPSLSIFFGESLSPFAANDNGVFFVSDEGKYFALGHDSNAVIFLKGFIEVIEFSIWPEKSTGYYIPLEESYRISPPKEWLYFEPGCEQGAPIKKLFL